MGTGTVPPAALLLLLGMVGGTEALSKWRVFETRHVVGDVDNGLEGVRKWSGVGVGGRVSRSVAYGGGEDRMKAPDGGGRQVAYNQTIPPRRVLRNAQLLKLRQPHHRAPIQH